MTRTRFAFALVLALTAHAVGAPTAGYPLAVAPDRAFDAVAGLDPAAGHVAPAADERALFADAADGTFHKFSFAEGCLMASGATDPAVRKKYLGQIDRIEADAKTALTGAGTVREKAERLLRFLHAGPMKKGYRADQTDLHTLLDTGTFNCVSSAALYNVIGRRLGLDLRAVEVPGHVFAVLVDAGRRIDVETTNKEGFDPDRAKGKAGKRHAGTRREVGEAGLAAVIAYNHGVALAKAKRFPAALAANLRALALDRDNPSAAANAVADLTNWPTELSKAGKYEEALAVLKAGRELTAGRPAADGLKKNALAVFDAWANGHMKRGEWAAAIRVYERGLAALPGDKHLARNLAYCRQEQGRAGKTN